MGGGVIGDALRRLQVASWRLKVSVQISEVGGDTLVDEFGRWGTLEIGKLGGLLVDHLDVLGGEMNGGQSGVDGESGVASLES